MTAINDLDIDAHTKRCRTNDEVLAVLYEIRDLSLDRWRDGLRAGIEGKEIVALSCSLERAQSAIKHAEGIAAAKALNAGNTTIVIAGFDPSALDTGAPEQAEA